MIGLAGAILVTSLLGSMHCVGMCGPMALWASGIGQAGQSRGTALARLTAYHFGRAVTFLSAGLLAGWLGGLATVGGDWLGWQQTAARLAGATMIGLGVWRLLNFWRPAEPYLSSPSAKLSPGVGVAGVVRIPWDRRLSMAVSVRLSRLRPTIARLPIHSRAFAIGIVTTWLPCGWLYLFVLVAAATASPLPAVMVMFAFWIGTLPALSALVGGASRLSRVHAPFASGATPADCDHSTGHRDLHDQRSGCRRSDSTRRGRPPAGYMGQRRRPAAVA